MSQLSRTLPHPPVPGKPLSAGQFAQPLVAAVALLQRQVAQLQKLVGDGSGKAVRRIAAYVVSSSTGSPSTYGNTTYTVRAVGADDDGDMVGVKPVNRIIDDDNVPVVPAADRTPCVIVRSFDATGAPISWLELWEKSPGQPCTSTTPP